MRIDQTSFVELNRARGQLLITISKRQLLASERTRLMNDLFRILSGGAQRSLLHQLMISLKVLSRLE